MRQRFIQSFPTSQDIQSALDNKELGKPYVAFSREEPSIDWNSKELTPPLSAQPLTIEIESASTITFKLVGGIFGDMDPRTIYYSINNSDWISITSSLEGAVINVSDGDVVKLKGDNQAYTSQNPYVSSKHTYFIINGTFKLYGNPASLLSSSAFTELTKFGNYSLAYLFKENTGLTEARLSMGNVIFSNNSKNKSAFMNFMAGCTNLRYIWCDAQITDNLNSSYPFFQNWVENVSATGTFVKHPDATWTTGADGVPTGWTVVDAEI